MWVFDTSNDGLRTVMKEYEEIAIRILWETDEENMKSQVVWLQVNKILMEEDKSISRASIINFLNDMVDAGVLEYEDRSGKGGYHRVYSPAFDEKGFKRHMVETVISKLLEIWPEEARAVLVEKLS